MPGIGKQTSEGFEYEVAGRHAKAGVLEQRLEMLEGMINALSDPVTLVNEECRMVWANRAAERIFHAISLGKACEVLPPKGKINCNSCHIKNIIKEGGALEHEIEHRGPDGEKTIFRCSSRRVSLKKTGQKTVVTVFHDISNQKHAEKALEESETNYREIADTIPGVVYQFLLRKNGSYLAPYMSETAETVLGISAKEVIAHPDALFERIVEEDRVEVHRSIAESARTQCTWLKEFRIRELNGKTKWIRATSKPHIQANGDILWNGVLLDISDRVHAQERLQMFCDHLGNQIKDRAIALEKTNEELRWRINDLRKAEKALRESEEKYRLLVENANDAIFVLKNGEVMFYNAKALEIGRELGVNLTKSCFTDYIHPEDREMIADRHRRRLKGESLPANCSFRLKSHNDRILWVDLNSVLFTWEGQPATLNFMRDITAQKNLETRLFNTQKLESLGTIASGIAHDFNNLLMAIQGNASLLSLDIGRHAPQYESLKNIERFVKSGSELTRQLLCFAKGTPYELKPTDLNQLILKSSDMFGHARKEIDIQTRLDPNLWPAEIDHGQITQVLLNIYLNAWQAMPGGGNLVLMTENIELDEASAGQSGLKPGRYVKITITDNGVGMDEETREKVFEPFFTTKEKGRGTGLGLTSAYRAINNHGGFIDVSSSKGEGSTFSIYLKATDKKIENEETPSEPLLKGKGTLLFVDDEEIVLNIGVKLLQKLGYEVITARSGFEAIEIYEANRDRIDMVLLDLVMPGMDGGETYDRLKALNPDIKALLSSGYSVGGKASEILSRGCDGFLQKPYRIKALSMKIREILRS